MAANAFPTPANAGNATQRQTIGAARAGYLDALNDQPFRSEFDAAERVWQRNYETGRMWAVGFRAAGIEPPPWIAGEAEPKDFQRLLRLCTERIGSIRPEVMGEMAADPTLAMVVRVPIRRGRRLVEAGCDP